MLAKKRMVKMLMKDGALGTSPGGDALEQLSEGKQGAGYYPGE